MDLSSALAPVAARTIAQFSGGVTVRLRTNAPQRLADASTARQWSDVAGMTAAPVILEDIGAERALRAWGAEKKVTMEATVTLPAGVSIEPVDLALQIVGGRRDGTRWLVVGLKVEDTSRTATLALQATRDLLGLP